MLVSGILGMPSLWLKADSLKTDRKGVFSPENGRSYRLRSNFMSQYPPLPQPGGYPSNDPPSEGASGLAIAALVCGLIGFCFPPLGIVAMILGIVFLNQSRDGQSGRGMALAGTILGAVGLVLSILALLIAILLPALGAARRTARRMQNSTQLRGIHQGLVTFANSNKDQFPGLSSNGGILADGVQTGNSGDGSRPQSRMWICLLYTSPSPRDS